MRRAIQSEEKRRRRATMREKVVAHLTEEEVERSYYFLRKENELERMASRLLDKRAELERDRMEFWEGLIEKYGLKKGVNYSISHVLGVICEPDDEEEDEEAESDA